MRYIVKIKDNAYLDQERAKLVATTNVTVVNTLENLKCVHIDCAESVIDTIDKTGITWINQDYEMIMHGSRSTTMTAGNYWHLDAVTKRDFSTYNNNQYSYPDTLGKNTDIYVVDSGVTGASYLPTGDLKNAQVTWASYSTHWNLTLDYGLKTDFTSESGQEIKLTCEYLDSVPAVPGSAVHWNVTTAQGNQYDFTWDTGSANDTLTNGFSNTPEPDITLIRGATYEFDTSGAGSNHPLEIRTALAGSAYNTGVTNNGVAQALITFVVPTNAPDTLYYQCTVHANMEGTLNIVDPNTYIPSGIRFDHIHNHVQGVWSAPNIQAATINQATNNENCWWEINVSASNAHNGINAKEMVATHNLGKRFRVQLTTTGAQASVTEDSLKNAELGLKNGIEHTELVGRVEPLPGFNPYATTPHGTPATGSGMEDTQGHGTQVSLCAAGANSGVASKSRIYAVKVMDMGGTGSNSGYFADIQAGLDASIAHHTAKAGARESVLNASIGSGPKAPSNMVIYADEVDQSGTIDLAYTDSLKLAVAAGIHVTVSAGNGFKFANPEDVFQGPMNAEIHEPGIANGGQWNIDSTNPQDVICVGATNYDDTAAYFSDYGPSVDCWAPGRNVWSPKWDVGNGWAGHAPTNPADWTDGGTAGQFEQISGTSFASPIVAGIVALHTTEQPAQTPAAVKTWLTGASTADRVSTLASWKAVGITDPLYSTNASAGWKLHLNTADHSLANSDRIQFYGVGADIAGVTKEELVKDDWVVNAVTVDGGGAGVDVIALDPRTPAWRTITANANTNGGGANIRWAQVYDAGTTTDYHEGTDGIRHYLYREGGGHNNPLIPSFNDTNNALHGVAWRQPTEVESINKHVYQELVDMSVITYGTAAGDLGTISSPSGSLSFDLSHSRTTWATEPLTPTYSVTGTLPPGLTLSSTGQLTGVPTFPNVATQYSFTIISATVGGSAAYTMTLNEAEEVGVLYDGANIATTGQVKGKTIRVAKTVWFGASDAADANYDVKARPADESPLTEADIQCFSGNAYKIRDFQDDVGFTCRFKAPANPASGDTFSIAVLTQSSAQGAANAWYIGASGSNFAVDFGSGDLIIFTGTTGNGYKKEWVYEYTSAVGWIRTGLVNNEWS